MSFKTVPTRYKKPTKENGSKRCRWAPRQIPEMSFITRHEIEKLTCGPD